MWFLPLLIALAGAPADDRNADLHDAIASYVQPLGLGWDPDALRVAWVDLNRDGLDEAVVYLTHSDWCETGGCTVLVFEQMDDIDAEEFGRFRPAAEIHRVTGPIMAVRTRGYWSDLIVTSPRGPRRLRFNGDSYPMSPTAGTPVQGRMPRGTVLFAAQ